MIRFLIRLVFWMIFSVAISIVVLNTVGGPIVSFALKKATKMEIKVEEIHYWGRELVIKGLSVDKYFEMKRAEISPSIKDKSVFLDKIYLRGIKIRIFPKEGKGGMLPIPIIPSDSNGEKKITAPFRSFDAEDVEVNICKPDGKCIIFKDCDIKIYHPNEGLFFNIELFARIGDGRVSAKGWIDWDKKDADIDFESKDIDLTEFRDYFNINALSGKLNLKAKAVSKDDNLKIDNELQLSGIGMDSKGGPITSTLLSALAGLSSKGHVNVKFSLNTKLSSPDITLGKILSKIYKERRPDQYVKDTALGTAESVLDLVGDVVGGLINQFKKDD